MAGEYQNHLNNLILDLRKDLGNPGLPVVVAAIAWDGSHSNPVRDAQLAAANPSHKITTVDTRSFLRPSENSPGNRPDLYHQNA